MKGGLRNLYGKHVEDMGDKKLVNISVDLINEDELLNEGDEKQDHIGNSININEQSKWFEVDHNQSSLPDNQIPEAIFE